LDLRKKPSNDPRSELYRIFDYLHEVLDHDLDFYEKRKIDLKLKNILEKSKDSEISKLASSLINFIESKTVHLVSRKESFWNKLNRKINYWKDKFITQKLAKIIIISALIVVGLFNFWDLIVAIRSIASSNYLQFLFNELLNAGKIISDKSLPWFLIRLILEGIVGILFIISAGLFYKGKDKKASRIASFALIASLTTIDLLVFYFDQFKAVSDALMQFVLLNFINYYKKEIVRKN